MERIKATYTIETAFPLNEAASAMAGEQSTGTFLKLKTEADPIVQRQASLVEAVTELEDVAQAFLPGSVTPKNWNGCRRRGMVTLSWPLDTIGPSLPNLLATIAGNLFELQQLSGIRLNDIDLPRAFLDRYPGPGFGIAGTRKLTNVETLPLIGTIIKPSVGLTPEATAATVSRLIEAGIDFIKDDELQSDGPFCPFGERVDAVMRVINQAADRYGRKVMFAFNITGEVDEMYRRHDIVKNAGGTCIMVSLNSVGMAGFSAFRKHSALPIHAHRNGWGLYYRSPYLGIDYTAYQKLWRVAGVDHLHVNGIRNKFAESGESSIASARACLTPLAADDACLAMPVFSSAQWAGQAVETYQSLGSADLIYACGGGIVGHPGGIAAGVESVKSAWRAALSGQTLADRAKTSPELAAALDFFG